ncbi:MAG: hypothetical protein ABI867_37660, partial [Kofleriaceae bacterium]
MRFVLTLSVLAICMAGLPSTQSRRTDPDATRIENVHNAAKMLPSRRIGADTVDHRLPLQAVV